MTAIAISAPTVTPEAKRTATARARAALRGIVVHVMPNDASGVEFVVTQGAWTRSLTNIEELEMWLDRVDGTRGA